MVTVNVGLWRPRRTASGRRRGREGKNLQGVEFTGDWGDDAAHERFRQQLRRDHPGWNIEGYALILTYLDDPIADAGLEGSDAG